MTDGQYMEHAPETEAELLPMKWADGAMFEAEAIDDLWMEDYGVVPKVHLLTMTDDPLGAIAAMSLMYEGTVVRNLAEVTDKQRRSALADMQRTHLPAPLEAVKLHFMIDGADRAFQQQLTRQRTAVYAGESLRFAVLDGFDERNITLPPSVFQTNQEVEQAEWPSQYVPSNKQAQRWRDALDTHAKITGEIYSYLVNDGMPAEDARSVLPLSTATRINYVTDLRNLVSHAGNRLCTQAQYHWRLIFNQIVQQIREYGNDGPNAWQFRELANSSLFRPVCYQLGRCPFKATFDRPCSIRSRVDAFAAHGVPSGEWSQGNEDANIAPISDNEWLMDPAAARRPRAGS